MIQCSTEKFPHGHSDGIIHIKKFTLTDIGECEIIVFPYQDDENPPTVYIVKNDSNIIVCGVRLDAPLFYGGNYTLTKEQKIDINNVMNSYMDPLYNWEPFKLWGFMCGCWSGLNDRLEKITLPDSPPDYTKLQ